MLMSRSMLRQAPFFAVGVAAVLLFASASFAQGDSPDLGDLALEPPADLPPAGESPPPEAAADPPPPPKFVVLPTKAKGGPNLKKAIKKLVEKALKKNKKYTVVPYKKYKKGAKKAKVKKKALHSPASAQKIGEKLGLTHALIIEGSMEQRPVGKKKVKVYFAIVTLVDIKTGDVVHTKRWALKGKKLSKEIAAKLVAKVEKALEPPPPPPPPEPEVEDLPPDPPPPPPDLPPDPMVADSTEPGADDLALTMPDAAASDTVSSDTDSVGGEVTDEELAAIEDLPPIDEPLAEDPLTVARIDEPITIEQDIPPPQAERSERWRPYLHAVIGGMGMSRRADIRAKNAPQTPPCFCARDEGAMEPIFPAGYFAAEFYPMAMPALGGKGAIYEGVGLHLEAFWTQVTTIIDTAGEVRVGFQTPRSYGQPAASVPSLRRACRKSEESSVLRVPIRTSSVSSPSTSTRTGDPNWYHSVGLT